MSREIRSVPLDYEHPLDENGMLQPMFDKTYKQAMEEWIQEVKEFQESKESKEYSLEDWLETLPDPEYYHPDWTGREDMGIQLFETCSEGTPQTPVFPNTEDGKKHLVEYAAKHATTFGYSKATAQQWWDMLFNDDSGLGVHTVEYPNGNKVVFI